MNERDSYSGFTLVELLIVMAIIVLMTSVTVPAMMGSGMFGGEPTNAGARDLFAQLRAANVHATTKNMDTAVAYGIATDGVIQDSTTGNRVPQRLSDSLFDSGTLFQDFVPLEYQRYAESFQIYPKAPVFDTTILVRRLTIQELNETDDQGFSLASYLIGHDPDDEYNTYAHLKTDRPFVPVNNEFGRFQPLPRDTCLLTNKPEMLINVDSFRQKIGLYTPNLNHPTDDRLRMQGIAIFRIENDEGFIVDRLLPKVSDGVYTDGDMFAPGRGFLDSQGFTSNRADLQWTNRFPAHVFKKTGGLDTSSGSRQRIKLSVGVLPNAEISDRFLMNEETGSLYTEFQFRINEETGLPYTEVEFFQNFASINPNDLVGLETDIYIYTATGRVKVAPADV